MKGMIFNEDKMGEDTNTGTCLARAGGGGGT
jgi:hypothetical protein